jgi:hypothetical protein
MAAQYRNQSNQALDRAREQMSVATCAMPRLNSGSPSKRSPMTGALAYEKELPAEAKTKWQPKQVMDALIEIDPYAGTNYRLSVGVEAAPGVLPERMIDMGEDVVFGLSDIKRHYHALGSYLHMPSMQQVSEEAGVNEARMRERLEATADALTKSLASKVWNCTLSQAYVFDCFRCEQPVRKRVADQVDQIVAICSKCRAPHISMLQENGKVIWHAQWTESPCPTKGCAGKRYMFADELVLGTWWTCAECEKSYCLDLGARPYSPLPNT